MANHKYKIDPYASHGWTATYKIGKVITSNFNLEEVLSLIGKIVCTVTKSDAASIVTNNNNGNENGMFLAGSFGLSKKKSQNGILEFESLVTQQLTATKKVFLISNIKKNAKFNRDSLVKGTLSALCVPAIFNNRFLASLILYSKKSHSYTSDQIKISSALAYQIALAIQNYNLYTGMHVNYFNTIRSLVLAMEAKDPYTKGHSERVTEYAFIIASNMGLSGQQIQMIKYCGLLHDLGKIAIPDHILNKKGPLSSIERKRIQRHPVEGADVLSPLAFLQQGVSLVKYHHERFDGSGYPDGLKGEKIPLAARILACADAYDAMTSDRPYRSRLTKELAMEELKNNAGTQFDPDVANIFLKSLEIGPEEQ